MKLRLIIGCVVCMLLAGCMASWNIETSMVDGKWRTTLTVVTEGEPEKAVDAVIDLVVDVVTPG